MERPFLFMQEKGRECSVQLCRQQAGKHFMWQSARTHNGQMCVSASATSGGQGDRARRGDNSVQIHEDSRKMHVMLGVSMIDCRFYTFTFYFYPHPQSLYDPLSCSKISWTMG